MRSDEYDERTFNAISRDEFSVSSANGIYTFRRRITGVRFFDQINFIEKKKNIYIYMIDISNKNLHENEKNLKLIGRRRTENPISLYTCFIRGISPYICRNCAGVFFSLIRPP